MSVVGEGSGRVTPSASVVGCCLIVLYVYADVGRFFSRGSWFGCWVVGAGGQRCGGAPRETVQGVAAGARRSLLVALLFGVGGFHGRRLNA